jgi:hypothetical protein
LAQAESEIKRSAIRLAEIHNGGFDGVLITFDREVMRAASIQKMVNIAVDLQPQLGR